MMVYLRVPGSKNYMHAPGRRTISELQISSLNDLTEDSLRLQIAGHIDISVLDTLGVSAE